MTQSEDTLRQELAAAVVVVILGIFMFNCYADVGGTRHICRAGPASASSSSWPRPVSLTVLVLVFVFLAPKKENSQGLLSLGKTVSSATTNTSNSSSGAAAANRDQIMPLWDVDAALG